MDELKKCLDAELEKLSTLDPKTKEYEVCLKAIEILSRSINEHDKIKNENSIVLSKNSDEKKFHIAQIVISAFTAISGLALPIWGTITTMNFEKEDSTTTTAGRRWFGSLFNRK